jgi:hypothetical protein
VLAASHRQRVVELCLLQRERVGALAHLVELAHGALALVLHAPHAVLQLAQLALRLLHGVARLGDDSPRFVLRLLVRRELRFGGGELGLLARPLRGLRARAPRRSAPPSARPPMLPPPRADVAPSRSAAALPRRPSRRECAAPAPAAR